MRPRSNRYGRRESSITEGERLMFHTLHSMPQVSEGIQTSFASARRNPVQCFLSPTHHDPLLIFFSRLSTPSISPIRHALPTLGLQPPHLHLITSSATMSSASITPPPCNRRLPLFIGTTLMRLRINPCLAGSACMRKSDSSEH